MPSLQPMVRAVRLAGPLQKLLVERPLPGDPTLETVLKAFGEKSDLLSDLTRQPVRVSVQGDYNAAKTIFIRGLIGCGLLPAEEEATTGNLTVMHLRQAGPGQSTRFGKANVQFLNRNELHECLKFMLDEVQQLARQRLENDLLLRLSQLQGQPTLNPGSVREWIERVWTFSDALSPQSLLPYALLEILRLCDSWTAMGDSVAGMSHSVDSLTGESVNAWIRLPETPTIGDALPLLPTATAPLPAQPGLWSLSDWRTVFSGIARVEVDVEVSPDRWLMDDRNGVRSFDLCDFPGRGALGSGLRDKFLSIRELKRTHVRVLLLNGRSPNGRGVRDVLEAVSIDAGIPPTQGNVVLIGRFDDLPIDGNGGPEAVAALAQDPGVTDQKVLDQFPALRRLYEDALALTGQDPTRIGFLSPILKAVEVDAADPILKAKHQSMVPKVHGFCALLRPLADQLRKCDPETDLGKWLNDYVIDGGMGCARQMIVEQVRTRGVRVLNRRVEAVISELEKLAEQVQGSRVTQPIPAASIQEIRNALRKIIGVFTKFQDQLEAGPVELRSNGGQLIAEQLEEFWHDTVAEWPVWRELRTHTRNGTIEMPSRRNLVLVPVGDLRSSQFPTDSEYFFSKFRDSLVQLEARLSQCVQEGLLAFIARMLTPLSDERLLLAERMHGGAIRQRLIEQFDHEPELRERASYYLNLLEFTLRMDQPEHFASPLMKAAVHSHEPRSRIDPASLYPLPRCENGHGPLIFGWSEAIGIYSPPPSRSHGFLVNRLIVEFVRTGILGMEQALGEISKSIREVLLENIVSLVRGFYGIVECMPLLSALAEERAGHDDPWARFTESLGQLFQEAPETEPLR